jgi:hypothetical protein
MKIIYVAGYLPEYLNSSFVVVSTEDGTLRSVYGGLFAIEGYGEEYFFPTWVTA